ncbi:hypothetical protein M885DRAFT_504022, partial [Pelagophyceae sp. CCMP2097]
MSTVPETSSETVHRRSVDGPGVGPGDGPRDGPRDGCKRGRCPRHPDVAPVSKRGRVGARFAGPRAGERLKHLRRRCKVPGDQPSWFRYGPRDHLRDGPSTVLRRSADGHRDGPGDGIRFVDSPRDGPRDSPEAIPLRS